MSKFGSNAHNHTTYIGIQPNYHTKSSLAKNLLLEDAIITSKRHTRTLNYILTTTKHVWLYLLFIVLRYHEVFSSAISLSALPPYDIIFQECLDAFQNCDKLNDAVFQMFLIHKRHMAEHTRLKHIEYSKRLNRTDILPADSTFNDSPISETNNENDVTSATQASTLTTTNISTNFNENVDRGVDGGANEGVDYDANEDIDDRANQYSSSVNNEEVSAGNNSSDGDDNGNNIYTENASFSSTSASNNPEGFEAFLSKRLDSFADSNKRSKIPLPFDYGKDEKDSYQEYGPVRRNLYLQDYIDNQQLEVISEAEEEPEQEPEQVEIISESEEEPDGEPVQESVQNYIDNEQHEAISQSKEESEQVISQQHKEESESEIEDNEQTADVQDSGKQDKHVEKKSIQQHYVQNNNISSSQQSNLPNIQQNWPFQVDATASPQESTVNAVNSTDFHSPANIPIFSASSHQTSSSSFIPVKEASSKPHGTSSRSASGRRRGVSFQDSSSSSRYTTHQEYDSSSQAETFQVDDEKIFNKDIYNALKMSRAATRINSLAELGVSLKHYEIDLMDPRFYYNPDGTDNLYDGPKEIAEKLGVRYTESNIAVVCQDPLKCEICTKPTAKRKLRFF